MIFLLLSRIVKMNYEYTKEELQSFDRTTLLTIEQEYNSTVYKNAKRQELIHKILSDQDRLSKQRRPSKLLNKFNSLPADILRLLGLYLDVCDIVDLCRINKKINNSLCRNNLFLLSLGHQRLTEYDERFEDANILEEIDEIVDLEAAVFNGYLEKVKYLIEHDADVHEDRDYMIVVAARNGYLDIVEYLVSHGIDIHAYGDWALIEAAKYGYLNIVKYLLSQGADMSAQNGEALVWAATGGHLDIVKYLISQDADILTQNGNALDRATVNNRDDVIKYLVSIFEKSPNINKYGTSEYYAMGRALRIAMMKENLELVKYLIEHGADPHFDNDSILYEAQRKGYNDIVEYLKSLM